MTRISVVVNNGLDIYILGNGLRSISSIKFLMLLMKFIHHAIRPHSEKRRHTDHENDNPRSHNALPII